MSDRLRNARNVAIILALAAAVYFIPGGGRTAATVESVLWVGFGVALGFIALRVYRERRFWLNGLGDHARGLFYAVCALVLFLLEARWWIDAGGWRELLWFVLAGLGIWAAMEVYRRARSY
jgi:hypothetical protein